MCPGLPKEVASKFVANSPKIDIVLGSSLGYNVFTKPS